MREEEHLQVFKIVVLNSFNSVFYLPEVFVDKGRLGGGQAFPAGFASGIDHQNRVNLKASALETTGGSCKHLKRSHVMIKPLKAQYVSSHILQLRICRVCLVSGNRD